VNSNQQTKGETMNAKQKYDEVFAACQAGGMSSQESHEYAKEMAARHDLANRPIDREQLGAQGMEDALGING
jgi:hypothetical protein